MGLKKRELQKKVKELERQVIEISPDAPLDLNGILEEGEINDKDKKGKKKIKEKAKLKKKNRKKLKAKVVAKEGKVKENADSNPNGQEEVKDEKVGGRNYRKKKSINNDEDEMEEKGPVVKRKESKKKDKSK